MPLLLVLLFLITAKPGCADEFHAYVGDVGPDSVILAWGTTEGRNTIGRSSSPHGEAVIHLGDEERRVADKNWVRFSDLEPDRPYDWRIELDGVRIGDGLIRTWPREALRVAFIVMGDYGNASTDQRAVASVMAQEVETRARTENPIRFVLTTGDNIYGKIRLGYTSTGKKDKRWGPAFFEPYADVVRHVPFYPTLGNHDGNGSESAKDLPAYLDNFFFPGGEPARWYRFTFGGLVDFFGLDSTRNTESGPKRPAYRPGGEQHHWLRTELEASMAPWKLAYFHHPLFTAGPKHVPRLEELRHFHELFVEHDVQAVFSGHEHNFQLSVRDETTGGVQYVVTGAGGELRDGKISESEMREAQIAAWAPSLHFCLVEVTPERLTITPLGPEPVRATQPDGSAAPLPVELRDPSY